MGTVALVARDSQVHLRDAPDSAVENEPVSWTNLGSSVRGADELTARDSVEFEEGA
jgi:hypothetical protein